MATEQITSNRFAEVYPGAGEFASTPWYWRLRSPNGRITADGAESYTRRADCVNAARDVLKGTGYAIRVYGRDGGLDRVERAMTAREVCEAIDYQYGEDGPVAEALRGLPANMPDNSHTTTEALT